MITLYKRTTELILIAGLLFSTAFAATDFEQMKPPESRTIMGKVVKVLSGDSLQLLLPSGELLAVKLAGIKAPPLEEEIGLQSLAWLSSQLKDQLVSADCTKHDNAQHCVIFPDDRNINLVSVYNGYALFDENLGEVEVLEKFQQAQRHAKDFKIGLWSNE